MLVRTIGLRHKTPDLHAVRECALSERKQLCQGTSSRPDCCLAAQTCPACKAEVTVMQGLQLAHFSLQRSMGGASVATSQETALQHVRRRLLSARSCDGHQSSWHCESPNQVATFGDTDACTCQQQQSANLSCSRLKGPCVGESRHHRRPHEAVMASSCRRASTSQQAIQTEARERLTRCCTST